MITRANIEKTDERYARRSGMLMEATPGFEPGVKALQASALPLGHVAIIGARMLLRW